MGIPSDRILFPSERGDKTSFFQYMNPWSLTACSVSKLGAWNQRKSRRWASKHVPSAPCMDSGVTVARFFFFFFLVLSAKCFLPFLKRCDDLTATHLNYKRYEALQRGEEFLAAPRRALFRTEMFSSFPPVCPSLSTFLGRSLTTGSESN